jgi:protein phosphatase methylesterase 1
MVGRIPVYLAGNQGHVFLCLHGAGHSALSFAALAGVLKEAPYNSSVVSFDFRGHGEHFVENECDMNQQNLIDETVEVLKFVVERYPQQSIILVGHSMGGAMAIKTLDFLHNSCPG